VTPALDFKIYSQSTAPGLSTGWVGDDDSLGQIQPGIVTRNDAFDAFQGSLANSTKPQSKRLPHSRIWVKSDHATTGRRLSKYIIPSIDMSMVPWTPTAVCDFRTTDWCPFLLEDTGVTGEQNVPRFAKSQRAPDPLASYEQYASANWDAEGAEAITPTTLTYARRIMGLLPTNLGQPDVAPAADGSIALEWVPKEHLKLDRLFLDIGPGEEWRAYWMLRDGAYGRLPGEGYSTDTRPALRELFNELNR
jgi:hypothetical protein